MPQFRKEGFEADDVIASMAGRATAQGWDVLAVTGDRDVFQLVDENFRVLYTRRGVSDTVKVTPEWVEQRYSVPPLPVCGDSRSSRRQFRQPPGSAGGG